MRSLHIGQWHQRCPSPVTAAGPRRTQPAISKRCFETASLTDFPWNSFRNELSVLSLEHPCLSVVAQGVGRHQASEPPDRRVDSHPRPHLEWQCCRRLERHRPARDKGIRCKTGTAPQR